MAQAIIMYISNFTREEFGKKSNEPYIKERVETNLLNTFCQEVETKILVTKCIVNSLANAETRLFHTSFHVNWAMEFLGFAFSLPIDYESVIAEALEIYERWLLTENRPQCIKENESAYQQMIFGHLSLLFTERGGNSITHSMLCTKVLLLLKRILENLKLSDETWSFLLKLLLMISNTILCNMGALSQSISPLLLTVLFEVWVRSNTRDNKLWKELQQNSSLWLDHIWFISQWGSMIVELTKKVVSLLYGTYQTSTVIIFAGLEESQQRDAGSMTFQLEMASETALFYWHHFLTMMLDNTIAKIPFDYKVHKELTNTVAKVIDVFLEVCDKRNESGKAFEKVIEDSAEMKNFVIKLNRTHDEYTNGKARLPIPSVDGLLAIFGKWLFFHAVAHDSFSEFGNAAAIGVLCRVICKAQGPVNQMYLNKFYKTITEYFRKDSNPLIIGYIISNSQNLFSLDHRGARILAFDEKFLNSVKSLLSNPTSIAMTKPCCIMLSTVVGLNSILGNKICTDKLKNILLGLLKLKNEPEVFKRIIWSLAILSSTEDETNASDIINALVMQLQEIDYITQRVNYNALLSCISSFPYIVQNVPNAELIIEKLCLYIMKIQAKNTSESLTLQLFAILNWVICYPCSFFSQDTQKLVISTVSTDFSNKSVKASAEFVLSYLKNSLLSNFTYKNIKISSGIIDSSAVFHLVKHFLYKSEYVLSIYDVKLERNSNRSILCILRDSLGKYVWLNELNCEIVIEKSLHLNVQTSVAVKRTKQEFDELEDLPDDEMYDRFLNLFDTQSGFLKKAQEEHIEDYGETLKINTEHTDPPVLYRLLLSQLGLFHTEQLKDVVCIEDNCVSMISELDSIIGKNLLVFPILYLKNSESKISDTHGYFSSSFLSFLTNLGVFLTEEHKNIEIFANIKDLIVKYKKVIYCADSLNEIVFISPVLNNACDANEILDLETTVIIWNERVNDSYSLKAPDLLEDKGLLNKTIIQLIPAGFGKVKVKRTAKDMEGPLLDEMLINVQILPELLIRTLLNIHPMFCLRVMSKAKRTSLLKKIYEALNIDNDLAKIQKVLTNSFLP